MSKAWVLIIAIAVLSLGCVGVAAAFLRSGGGGNLIYAMDDPYIHMAMAKNLAASGVYGVTSHGFTSSSSSPLWTLLLAGACWLLAPREILPLVMNFLAAAGLLWVVYAIVRDRFASKLGALAVLLAVVFLCLMIPMIFTGMEHVLHGSLLLLLVWRCGEWLEGGRKGLGPGCIVLAILVTAARYESVFAIVALALVFAMHRRCLAAAILLAAGAVSPVLYGLISMSNGCCFLPNSLILKGHSPSSSALADLAEFLYQGLGRLDRSPQLFMLLVACCGMLLLRLRRGPLAPMQRLFAATFLMTAAMHLQLAETGLFYRYQTYLMTLGLVAFVVVGTEDLRCAWAWIKGLRATGKLVLVVLIAAVAGPLCIVSLRETASLPTAMTNIYQQQYQMARFIESSYSRQPIAAHDIGAVCYKANPDLLDLYGLGSMEVARAKMDRRFDTGCIRRLAAAKGVQMIVVYDVWFDHEKSLPPEWMCVARWRIPNNVVCTSDTVSFYAPTPDAAQRLLQNLQAFAPCLPAGVQTVYLTSGRPGSSH